MSCLRLTCMPLIPLSRFDLLPDRYANRLVNRRKFLFQHLDSACKARRFPRPGRPVPRRLVTYSSVDPSGLSGGMDSRALFDLLAAIALALTAMAGAYAPVWLSGGVHGRPGKRTFAFSIGNIFSAGVMVSAGFCHLLADAERRLHSEGHFPLAPFLCALGFLLTLFADEVAHNLSRPVHDHSKTREIAMLGKASIDENGPCCPVGVLAGENGSSGLPPSPKTSGAKHLSANTLVMDNENAPSNALSEEITVNGYVAQETKQRRPAKNDARQAKYNMINAQDSDDDIDVIIDAENKPLVAGLSGLLHLDGQPTGRRGPVSFLTAVLMGIALCFHSLLEGAAMGAERTLSDSLHIFVAIIAHKGLAAYALGSSLVDSKANSKRYWSVVLFFVFATPVGIGLGYIVSEVSSGNGAAAISALAAGTFLYVAAMEVIPKELENSDRWLLKLMALLTGFGAMSLLAIWA